MIKLPPFHRRISGGGSKHLSKRERIPISPFPYKDKGGFPSPSLRNVGVSRDSTTSWQILDLHKLELSIQICCENHPFALNSHNSRRSQICNDH